MCTGAEIPALLAAAGAGDAAAASAPLIGAEIGSAADLAAGLGGAGLAGGLGAGAAGELGATSSSIGAAGAPANPLSVLLGNAKTAAGPMFDRLGTGLKAYQGANAAMGLLGGGQTPSAPAARPMGQPAPLYSAQQVLGRSGGMGQPMGAAGLVRGAMGGAPVGGGQMSPQMLMALLQQLQQQGGQ